MKITLDNFGKPKGYVRRQVEGWSRRWVAAVTPDTVNCDNIIRWLNENMPEESGKASVIHNDYKLDNVIFDIDDPMQVIGVLDWEMSTVGDPLMDLGCTLGSPFVLLETEPEAPFRNTSVCLSPHPHWANKKGLKLNDI